MKSAPVIGELVGNYEIVGVAGAGGMGVVYRARDLRLHRIVALKFLPPQLNASARDKERFLREARTASSLDHANIGVIHGIEELEDGRTFIVMAFYEGQSLGERIRGAPLGLQESLDTAIQIACGLTEAHARQIVHRDIKPSNVMITQSGSIKIVDFGLAHNIASQSASETGVVGTVRYMSPEQALGKHVDQRTDIWALGVVLAEMLTGRNPFERESVTASLMAIINEAPGDFAGVPEDVQQIIYCALSKDPDKRYQQSSEMLADLERARSMISAAGVTLAGSTGLKPKIKSISRFKENASVSAYAPAPQRNRSLLWIVFALTMLLIAAAAIIFFPPMRKTLVAVVPAQPEKHIAVLPFENLGNNPENTALVEGLTDTLAGKLSNLDVGNKSLWVIPTSEVRRLKIADPGSALKQLGANLVVKGSVSRDGQAVHLSANLIDTKDLRQLGSAEVDDPAGDLSTLQNEAVSQLAKLMNVSVSADMIRNTGGSVNPAAYEDYLTAVGQMQRYDKPGNLDAAIATLKNSVKTDPRFALGYAQLAEAYRLKYVLGKDQRWLTEAQANSQKAIEIDNHIPAVYVTLGLIHESSGHGDLAVQEFQHALELDQRNPGALTGLAHAYERSGRIADAEAAFKKVVALRPGSWDGYNDLGMFYDRQSRDTDAIAALEKAIKLTPDNAQLYLNLGVAYVDSGDTKKFPAAEQALTKSISLSPSYPAYANLGILYAQQQRWSQSAAATEKALQLNDKDYLVWNNLMVSYQWLKERNKADSARDRMLPLVERAVASKPRDGLAQAELAVLLAKAGDRTKALDQIQTSMALAPDDAGVLELVTDAYEILGDRRHALEYFVKALKKGYSLDQLRTDPDLQVLLNDPAIKAATQ
jgi:serine/threonine-protein kinase